jgi:hypothetical protein
MARHVEPTSTSLGSPERVADAVCCGGAGSGSFGVKSSHYNTYGVWRSNSDGSNPGWDESNPNWDGSPAIRFGSPSIPATAAAARASQGEFRAAFRRFTVARVIRRSAQTEDRSARAELAGARLGGRVQTPVVPRALAKRLSGVHLSRIDQGDRTRGGNVVNASVEERRRNVLIHADRKRIVDVTGICVAIEAAPQEFHVAELSQPPDSGRLTTPCIAGCRAGRHGTGGSGRMATICSNHLRLPLLHLSQPDSIRVDSTSARYLAEDAQSGSAVRTLCRIQAGDSLVPLTSIGAACCLPFKVPWLRLQHGSLSDGRVRVLNEIAVRCPRWHVQPSRDLRSPISGPSRITRPFVMRFLADAEVNDHERSCRESLHPDPRPVRTSVIRCEKPRRSESVHPMRGGWTRSSSPASGMRLRRRSLRELAWSH